MTGISPDAQIHLITDVELASRLMSWLGERRPEDVLAWDTETTGLREHPGCVRLVQVGDGMTAWVIPFERWGGVFEEVLSRWTGDWVGHNATFDVGMLSACGIEMPRHRIHDTMIMSHVLEPEMSIALKNQAARHVDRKAANAQRGLDQLFASSRWSWDTVPIMKEGPASIYWAYAGLDVLLTYHLMQRHWPLVRAEAPRAYDLELGVRWVVDRMTRRGVTVDREFTTRQFEEFDTYVTSAAGWVAATYGINAGTTNAVIKVLQDEGFEFNKLTESGALSLDKEVLADIAHPLAETVLRRRQVQKLQSTYLRRFLEYSEADGLLHPRINSVGGSNKKTGSSEGDMGVRTSRMSMDTPNLQQLPRRGTNPAADVVRNCLTARPEHTLLMCDLDQIEMRLFAHLSDDLGMRRAFCTEDDFFTTVARDVYGDAAIEKKDPRRQVTKTTCYAMGYGAGPAKIAMTAGVSEATIEAFLTRFHGLYPGVRRFQRQTEQLGRSQGWIESPLTGRHFKAEAGAEYKLVNYKLQSLATEIFKMKLLELDAAGMGEWMVFPVHDEIVLDVPNEHLRDAGETVMKIMNDETLVSVPITSGLSHGPRYGEKSEWT